MTNFFGVDIEQYRNNSILKQPIFKSSENYGVLTLERNLKKSDNYNIKLSETLGFCRIETEYHSDKRGKKKMIRYDQHLKRLKKLNLKRSISSREFFSIVINMHRDELHSEEFNDLIDNIINEGTGEFLCDAIQRSDKTLSIFEKVTDITYNDEFNCYNSPDNKRWCRGDFSYDISNLDEGYNDLLKINKYCPLMIENLIGVPYDKIPMPLRFGKDRIRFEIPDSFALTPLSIGVGEKFNIGCPLWAGSRGVKEK